MDFDDLELIDRYVEKARGRPEWSASAKDFAAKLDKESPGESPALIIGYALLASRDDLFWRNDDKAFSHEQAVEEFLENTRDSETIRISKFLAEYFPNREPYEITNRITSLFYALYVHPKFGETKPAEREAP